MKTLLNILRIIVFITGIALLLVLGTVQAIVKRLPFKGFAATRCIYISRQLNYMHRIKVGLE